MVRPQPEENVPKRRHETATQSKPKSKVRLAFTAAALLCTAIIFNFCAAAPAKAAGQGEFQYPIGQNILTQKANAQCGDQNLRNIATTGGSFLLALKLDFMGFMGAASVTRLLINELFPDNLMARKVINCSTAVKDAVEEASQFTWRRDLVAERVDSLSRQEPSSRALAYHKDYVASFDGALFNGFWSGSPDREDIRAMLEKKYDVSTQVDFPLVILQARTEVERQVKNGRSTRALAPKPGS